MTDQEQAPTHALNTAEGPSPGDLGRRLAARRAELGLTRRQTANRAGIAPSYLRYLEEAPGAAPDAGALLRLAGVLETTVTELAGGHAGLPPGPGRAAAHPRFRETRADEGRVVPGT